MLYKNLIQLTLLDSDDMFWFQRMKRDAVADVIKKTWKAGPAFHHIDSIFLYSNAEVTLPHQLVAVSSALTLRFSSPVCVRAFYQDIAHDNEQLAELVQVHARTFFNRLPKQQDLFQQATFESMPEWLKKGSWIIPPSTQ